MAGFRSRRLGRRWLGVALAVMLAAAGAVGVAASLPGREQPAPPAGEVTVFAASSLTDAFGELAPLFEREHAGARVVFNFGASSALRAQIEQGAPADVFAAADERQMDLVVRAGLLAGAPRLFARNRLVIITPRADPAGIIALPDLARPGVKVVTAAPEVPVGAYTRQMLEQLGQDPALGPGFAGRVLANVVSQEPNVRQIVAKVQLGEADAAIVYASDVTPAAAPALNVLPVPEQANVIAAYPIAVTTSAANPELARRFVELALSPAGQAVLARQHFIPVDPAE